MEQITTKRSHWGGKKRFIVARESPMELVNPGGIASELPLARERGELAGGSPPRGWQGPEAFFLRS